MGRKSSVNVTDDTILFLGNAQLDCVYTPQSKSRCIRHQTILINGEIWSLNYLVPPAMLIKWTGSLPDLHFPQRGYRDNFLGEAVSETVFIVQISWSKWEGKAPQRK